MQWVSRKGALNSSEHFPRIFINLQPEEFTDRIIFMSLNIDIEWKTNDENCISNAEKVNNYAMRFSQGHWTFLGPGSEESGMEVLLTLKKGSGIVQPSKWCNYS